MRQGSSRPTSRLIQVMGGEEGAQEEEGVSRRHGAARLWQRVMGVHMGWRMWLCSLNLSHAFLVGCTREWMLQLTSPWVTRDACSGHSCGICWNVPRLGLRNPAYTCLSPLRSSTNGLLAMHSLAPSPHPLPTSQPLPTSHPPTRPYHDLRSAQRHGCHDGSCPRGRGHPSCQAGAGAVADVPGGQRSAAGEPGPEAAAALASLGSSGGWRKGGACIVV